ncbi:MFS transporter asaE [Vanrija pseudolonga]|uniref:MFS transporter asaE n=1 Tax=Vanrija pseudolonga TaxID=143232 RepID=A0AAF1BMA2_9TREE|nr:MFS transporter asaE [Vanrija pseudolonga]
MASNIELPPNVSTARPRRASATSSAGAASVSPLRAKVPVELPPVLDEDDEDKPGTPARAATPTEDDIALYMTGVLGRSSAEHPAIGPSIPGTALPSAAPSQAPTAANSVIELNIDGEGEERELPALAPTDRGRDAWLFLASATVIESIVWGLPYSVGVLHAYWSGEMFPGQESVVTLAATLQNGLLFVASGFLGPIFATYPQYTRHFQIFGLVCGTVSLLSTAFVSKSWHLIVTLGLIYPLSACTSAPLPLPFTRPRSHPPALYFPCLTLLYEWFNARRGLANGIMFSGAAAGGTFFPLLGQALLQGIGYKGTMLTLAGIFAVVDAVALVFIKRRIPVASRGSQRGRRARPSLKIDYSFMKKPAVYLFSGFVVFTSLANFIPSLWMPTFAEVVGPTNPSGTSLVAIMYGASVVGNLITGYLTDRLPVGFVLLGSSTISAVACWVLWGLGTSNGLLIAFSVVWGITALCTGCAWSKMVVYISKDDLTLPGLLLGVQTALRGAANFASGPLSTALLKSSALKGAAGAYGSTNYGALLLFTGAMTFIGGVSAGLFPRK